MKKQWINHPTILEGETVELIPLEKKHFEALFIAASDNRLWEFVPTDCTEREKFDTTYNLALADRKRGKQYPFVIIHRQTQKIIGSTKFFEIFPEDKKLEIGLTWIVTKYWATEVNFECKLLLLTYCFEVLKTRRVQLKADATNMRSRKAIEKIGGQFEGILRKDKIKENGASRSAAYYSIIDEEWETVKQKILAQIADKKNNNS